MKNTLKEIDNELIKLRNPIRAQGSARFFKTGKGEYGEGDLFLGLTTPQINDIVKKYWKEISLEEIDILFRNEYHEYRTIAVATLVRKYLALDKMSSSEENDTQKDRIFNFYLSHTDRINNWDLVDISAHKIVGRHLLDKDRSILYELACSKNLWERRISIISTFAFLDVGQFDDSIIIAEVLINDNHDLIHKAVGWVLREVGKRNLLVETKFLNKYASTMPRTMLRYAIEKFPEPDRQRYLRKRKNEGKRKKDTITNN